MTSIFDKHIKIIKLNEFDVIFKICENYVITIDNARVITHQLEIYAMTTEALSPPNNSQMLRERLIQEGAIVPSRTTQNIREAASEKPNDLTFLYEKFRYGKSLSFDYIMSIIKGQLEFANSGDESETTLKKPTFFWLLNFSLVIKKINKTLNFLFTNTALQRKNFVVSKNRFYSPFKENMKNTP